MAESSKPAIAPSNLPQYFNKLSQIYPRQTGNSTLNLFTQLTCHLSPISSDSTIHDNACGPGTATSVLLSHLPANISPKIIGTDMVPAMIEAFSTSFPDHPEITGSVMNSQTLSFPDNHFTHSMTNFSGQAAVTTWKCFRIGEVIHEVQRRVRPDLPLMTFSGPEMYDPEAVRDVLAQAGFARDGMKVLGLKHVVVGEDVEGLLEFAGGRFTDSARKGWAEEERQRWGGVLLEVVEEDKKQFGGLRFEGWAVLAIK